jgi:molybdate transport system substrate-binding protein
VQASLWVSRVVFSAAGLPPVTAALHSISLLLCLALVAASAACSRGSANETEINVAAAANLSDAFTALSIEFKNETGIRVIYSFGATADLERQIENGAPFDVFAAADAEHVTKLDQLALLTPGSRALYARGRLVIWTPPGSQLQITRLEDLLKPEVRTIAIAKPDLAPYGQASVEALQALHLWTQLQPKVVFAQNVSQARQYVATGNAEAGFLPLALVQPNQGHYLEVDEQLHRPIEQALGVVKASPKQEAARRFTQFVLGGKGQTLLEHFGYRRP